MHIRTESLQTESRRYTGRLTEPTDLVNPATGHTIRAVAVVVNICRTRSTTGVGNWYIERVFALTPTGRISWGDRLVPIDQTPPLLLDYARELCDAANTGGRR